jgi:putative hydrolase of the HAD superfamily
MDRRPAFPERFAGEADIIERMPEQKIKAVFTDVGGVILTNGWDTQGRKTAAERFHLNITQMDSRHRMTFDTFECGKLSLDDYLDRVVFYEPRSFSKDDFKTFMYAQSQPYPEMLDLMRQIKARNGIKLAVVSNEGRELTEYRIRQFGLSEFVDFFVSSCFVHLRKPDVDIFKMAIDMAHVPPQETIYVDDRPMFVEVAGKLGLQAMHHSSYEETRQAFERFGLL